MRDTIVASAPGAEPVAYLLKRFPRLSETFILREILELEKRGVPLRIYSILRTEERIVHDEVAAVCAEIQYIPGGLAAIGSFARAHRELFLRNPRRYARALRRALARGNVRAALKNFLRAGWLVCDLEKSRIVKLHAHFANAPASIAYFTSLLTEVDFSFTAHAKDIYTSPPESLRIKMRAARFVVTCTDFNRSFLSDLEATARIHVIYHGIQPAQFAQSEIVGRKTRARPMILSVGRLVEKKGFDDLIAAFEIVRGSGIDADLTIVGGGPLRESLERQARELGIGEHVHFLGALSQAELFEVYREATVFALACTVLGNGDRDGIPNVLVEAMAFGIPVVSTDVSGIPELVVSESTGLLVRSRATGELATAIGRLVREPILRERVTLNARRFVTEQFDMSRNVERLCALLVAKPS